MRRIIHHRLGDPADVLELVDTPAPSPASGMVLVRVTHAPVHPGDLLGIQGSPAFGPPPAIGPAGRGPGFEGAGVVEEIGPDCDPALGIALGQRVAFFPAVEVWSDRVAVAAASIIRLPEDLPSAIGAHMVINTLTARLLARAGQAALGSPPQAGAIVLQTGAASAVGRLLTTLLVEAGFAPIRLVQSQASAAILAHKHPQIPALATEDAAWQATLTALLAGREAALAYDSVGGEMIAAISGFLTKGASVINFGSLGGPWTDIRSIVPRQLVVRGVSIDQWPHEPEAVRTSDVAKALELARAASELFDVAGEYAPEAIVEAVAHVTRRGKTGTVMLRFS